MSSIPSSLSILASTSSSTPWVICGGLLFIGTAGTIYHMSPMRLTRILVNIIADAEKTYLDAIENGAICASDVETAETLSTCVSFPFLYLGFYLNQADSLQFKVSTIREASLRSSLFPFSALCDILNIHRSVAIVRCISEVRAFKTSIEILNESHLREIRSPHPLLKRAISLRQRDSRARI
ncbi:hypothetical protein K438DRAFT_2007514 [Mycena galopus ATCC 62051]|nr:hypothetical protein K438DRAFT_2007514 [Mycena galopus ATCC 62051]